MNWNRIKSFMILLLLCVNVYLMYMLAGQYRVNYLIDPDMKRDTIELLSKSGITVGDDVIPDKLVDYSVYESQYGDAYYETVLGTISGTNDYSLHMINNGIKCIIGESGDVYEFYDSTPFGMKYVSGKLELDDEELKELFDKADSGSDSGRSVGAVKEASLKRIAENFLSPSKDSTSENPDSVSPVSLELDAAYYNKESDKYIVYAFQTSEGCKIDGGEIEIIISAQNDRVEYLSGTIVWLISPNKYSSELIDQLNILFKEREYSESSEENAGDEIISVSSVYCVNWNSQRDTFYLIPAWKIEYSNGFTRIHNAINGAVYAK